MAAQRGADCGGRRLDAKPQQLALDALVAPPRIVLCEADDQLLDVVVQRWSAVAMTRECSRSGDQAAVPMQQRLGLDEEAGPAGSGQHATDRSQQGAVRGLELRSWDLAPKDAELVAQHQELEAASPRASSTSS